MNLKKLLVSVLMLLTIGNNFGQSRKVADRYFEEFSYVQSAKIYKDLVLLKGDSSKHVLSRLAESYYKNTNTQEAEIWYKKLISNFEKEVGYKELFKYAQVLRSNGKYKESDAILLNLVQTEQGNLNVESIKGDYLSNYSSQEKRIGIRNLAINTPYSDFGGFLLNGKSYFSSSASSGVKNQKIYKWNNQPFLNIYKAEENIQTLEDSEKDTILVLSNVEKLGAPIASEFHESNPVLTKDGKTMYFTRNNSDGKKVRRSNDYVSKLKLYKASYINGYWVNVKELPFNSDEYSVGHPALSPDEKTLYFVSDMPGGYGGSDIYKVAIKEKDVYGEPVNLGNKINTSEKEVFPYVGKDNVLYFSSNGHLGLGLLDIFQSVINEDGTFSLPENLGEPFNSKRDDFSFFVSEDGKRGFFSSNREKGKGDDDIYSFFIYTDSSVCKQIVKGVITDKNTGNPIDATVVQLINEQKELVAETISDELGNYVFKEVSCDSKYNVVASKLDHRSSKSLISLNNVKNKEVDVNLELVPLIVGSQIIIKPIYFDYGKADIREDAEYELENIITVMSNHPELVIRIESHTDSRGTTEFNRTLSDKRAKSTRDYILSRGIDGNRIESAKGYGESVPLNDCIDGKECTEEEYQLNRRSYFYIVEGGEFIKIRQQKEKKRVKRRITESKKSNFLEFLRKNLNAQERSSRSQRNKCFKNEQDCDKDVKKVKINYMD
ncbi:OmpA family protein [Tenacibaculum tangerinum]|uniref:OmpA family protein n=1 Tax=Tenacibaculum tangerinum TaxID=3038772 RepID=A0ABY8L2B0_9FLAO|nr:OmpA family protein [Tenacibaculum tangerinum]WGH75582.1 OmpA family protein [Tenacibaculum tangerinum]